MMNTQRNHKVEVLDLDVSTDRDRYGEILSTQGVEGVANETHITKANEKLIVLKYTEPGEAPDTEDFKTPILGF
jgi:hypothetical protein